MIAHTSVAPFTFSDTINIPDTTDPVQGGVGGTSNLAVQETAMNTSYLYRKVGHLIDMEIFTSSTTITSAHSNKLLSFRATSSAVVVCTLSSLSSFTAGTILTIQRDYGSGSNTGPVKILSPEGIADRYGIVASYIYLHNYETITLFKHSTVWCILECPSLYNVGLPFYGYGPVYGALVRQGQLIDRVQYARLYEWLQVAALAYPNMLVDDSAWLAGDFGKFSRGDGTTTFRLPDDRGMFDRALPLGRAAYDPDRHGAGVGDHPGDYQADNFEAHAHPLTQSTLIGVATGGVSTALTGSGSAATSNAGGTETRPKNTGKIPYIWY